MPPKHPTINESIAVIIERVDNYQKENRVYFKEINQHLEKLNGRTVEHESRLGTIEGRQGMAIRLIFYALGSGGLAGAVLTLLAKFGISGE